MDIPLHTSCLCHDAECRRSRAARRAVGNRLDAAWAGCVFALGGASLHVKLAGGARGGPCVYERANARHSVGSAICTTRAVGVNTTILAKPGAPYRHGASTQCKEMSVVVGPKATDSEGPPRVPTSYPYGSRAATALMISHGPQDGRQSLRADETAAAGLEDHIEARRLVSPDANRALVNDALLTASQQGFTDIITRLLATHRSTREGRANALARAAQYGRTRAVAVLLGAAAALHDDDDAPLRLAARNGRLLVVEQLLAAGAGVDAGDGYALHAAAYEGHRDVVVRLLVAGADVRLGQDKAFLAAAQRGHVEIMDHLLAAGADVHARTDEALLAACALGKDHVVSYLLAHGADVHALEDQAFRVAAKMGKESTVRLLLEAGADARAGDDEALWWAVEGGHEAIAHLLRANAAGALETRVQPSAQSNV